ncbi:HlyD family secretion protein [Synoicihabitans lomoniglobus]|uniref:HlyD family efflux transporter periplasmic adaptor subunit n=1 Tax=Synoicihabitans lomoniglobus TaxID=2909285 RepID=A0AAE9ZSN0_9BACT|nr:HlyD family efflux transporter periplasmic adaptor subunit [Opitutaceae bacterium LMO-M01]WED63526.1 HlyD family efflux transporter periplasmic adaptor subunit [Opitutaceae bacterium LMO-M01]
MKTYRSVSCRAAGWFGLAATVWLMAGCAPEPETRWQGYLEGEYVYVGSSLPGRLEQLAVKRGQSVEAGTPLFRLDQTPEAAARDVARERLAQAEAQLSDLTKGQRPSELATLEAQLDQARASAELSRRDLQRVAKLHREKVVPDGDFDRVRLNHEANEAQVTALESQLVTARLGGRDDRIVSARAEVAAARAALAQADWSVTEKSRDAPMAGLVFDTLFRPGEFVAAGRPVVALLPPTNLKVRFFVPEAARATLAPGDAVQVNLSGRESPVSAHVVYLSPQAEFTPPVLYNRENRAKLVFMIEAEFDAAAGVELLPGQPVDVTRAD